MNKTLGKILYYSPIGYNERRNEALYDLMKSHPAETKATIGGALDAISLGTASGIKGARTLKYTPKEIAKMKKTAEALERYSNIPLKQIEREGINEGIKYSKDVGEAVKKAIKMENEIKDALTKYVKADKEEKLANSFGRLAENGPIMSKEYKRLRNSAETGKAEAMSVLNKYGVEPTDDVIKSYITKEKYADKLGNTVELPVGETLSVYPDKYKDYFTIKTIERNRLNKLQPENRAYLKSLEDLEEVGIENAENLSNFMTRKRDLELASKGYKEQAAKSFDKYNKAVKDLKDTVLNYTLKGAAFIPVVGTAIDVGETIKDKGGLEGYKEFRKEASEKAANDYYNFVEEQKKRYGVN